MKVRMKSILAGPQRTAVPGQVIDVDDAHAADLIAGGYADDVALPDDEAVPVRTASPAAIALAEELGLDINRVAGSGKNGTVTKKDVEAAATAAEEDRDPETASLLPPENTAQTAGKPRKS